MNKRLFLLLLAACLMMHLLPMGTMAEETVETTEVVETTEATEETAAETTEATEETVDPDATSGTCGDGLTWVFEDRTLTISGKGEMEDGDPWASHKNRIKKVVLTGGVTKVGEECFYGYDRLESVDFGNALVEIGERAFYGCTELTLIHLPATFRIFGAECFRECFQLQKVYCDGNMPRFNSSCLWTGEYVAVFYPTNNIWPVDAVNQLVSNFGGRLGVMMGNYADSIEAEIERDQQEATKPEETEAPTEAPTEVPTEAPTEPATEPAVTETEAVEVVYITVPPTEATEAATEPQSYEEMTVPVWTVAPDAPEETPEDLGGKSWIGIVMIAGVLTFLAAGGLIFRIATKKGGRYNR